MKLRSREANYTTTWRVDHLAQEQVQMLIIIRTVSCRPLLRRLREGSPGTLCAVLVTLATKRSCYTTFVRLRNMIGQSCSHPGVNRLVMLGLVASGACATNTKASTSASKSSYEEPPSPQVAGSVNLKDYRICYEDRWPGERTTAENVVAQARTQARTQLESGFLDVGIFPSNSDGLYGEQIAQSANALLPSVLEAVAAAYNAVTQNGEDDSLINTARQSLAALHKVIDDECRRCRAVDRDEPTQWTATTLDRLEAYVEDPEKNVFLDEYLQRRLAFGSTALSASCAEANNDIYSDLELYGRVFDTSEIQLQDGNKGFELRKARLPDVSGADAGNFFLFLEVPDFLFGDEIISETTQQLRILTGAPGAEPSYHKYDAKLRYASQTPQFIVDANNQELLAALKRDRDHAATGDGQFAYDSDLAVNWYNRYVFYLKSDADHFYGE